MKEMRRVINVFLIAGATAVTIAVLFALTNILQDLWAQSIVPASPIEAEEANNTFKEMVLGFTFMALPFLGMMWGLTMALVRRR
jgi:hypothetical protein